MAYNPNTRLLLQFNEPNGSTTTRDQSAAFRAVNLYAGAEVVAGGGPTGAGALHNSSASSALLEIGGAYAAPLYDQLGIGGPLLLEMFFRATAYNTDYSYLYYLNWQGMVSSYAYFSQLDGTITVLIQDDVGSPLVTHTHVLANFTQWHHLRVAIDGTAFHIGLDGVGVHSGTHSSDLIPDQTIYPLGGLTLGGVSVAIEGELAQVRMLQNDYGWLGGSYTVPTTPYDTAPEPYGDYNPYTRLQLLFEQSPAIDTSEHQHPVTVDGDAGVVTSLADPFGGGALELAVTGLTGAVTVTSPNAVWDDYLAAKGVEMFVRVSPVSPSGYFFYVKVTDGYLLRLYAGGNYIQCEWYGDFFSYNASTTVETGHQSNGDWVHVRISFQNNVITFGVNGICAAPMTLPIPVFPSGFNIEVMEFGRYTPDYFIKGNLDNIVLTQDDVGISGATYVVPQKNHRKATLPGPQSATLSGTILTHVLGTGIGLGVPVYQPVAGNTLAYALPSIQTFASPGTKGILRRLSPYGSWSPRVRSPLNLLATPETRSIGDSSFWEVPPPPSANVGVFLLSQDMAVAAGVIGVINPAVSTGLGSVAFAHSLGGVTTTSVSTSFILNPTEFTHSAGALSVAVQPGVTGVAAPYVMGSLGVAKSVPVVGATLSYTLPAVSLTLTIHQDTAIAGGEVSSGGEAVQCVALTQYELIPAPTTSFPSHIATIYHKTNAYDQGVEVETVLGGNRYPSLGTVAVSLAPSFPVAPATIVTSQPAVPVGLPGPVVSTINYPDPVVFSFLSTYLATPPVPDVGITYSYKSTYVAVATTLPVDMAWSLRSITSADAEVTLDLRYSLLTDSAQSLYERKVSFMYALYSKTQATLSLDMKYSQLTPQVQERRVDISYVLGLREIAIDFKYAQVGSDWVTEMLGYINAERVTQGRTIMLGAYTDVGPDIATIQADTMRDLQHQAHDSQKYPVGWQTIAARGQRLEHTHGAIAENLLSSTYMATPDTTVFEAYTAWKNSPGHYANMMYDWPVGSAPTLLMGVAYDGLTPVTFNDENAIGIPLSPGWRVQYMVQVFIDMNPSSGSTTEMQRVHNFKWGITGAIIETYSMKWDLLAYTHVRARHTAGYALRVSSQMGSGWAVRAAVSHTAPQAYTVTAAHHSAYEPLHPVSAHYSASYDIEQYLRVRSDMVSEYGVRVGATMISEYSVPPQVSASMASPYTSYATVAGSMVSSYGALPVVRAQQSYLYAYMDRRVGQHTSSYDYRVMALAGHTASYSTQVKVQASNTDMYDLLQRNPVSAANVASYAMLSSSVEMVDTSSLLVVTFPWGEVENGGVDISTSEDEFAWTASVEILDPPVYASIAVDMPFSVTLAGTTFEFIVTGKSLHRSSPSSITMEITGMSPSVRLTEPRAATVSYTLGTAKMASILATELAGQAVTWGIVDWLIPPMYFAVENVTPIAAVQSIAEAAGGVVTTSPAGTLEVRYKFPVSVPDFFTAPYDFLLSDAEDNLSYSESVDTTDVVNKLRIRNGSDSVSDTLEFTQDENLDDYGILRAYPLPWRPVTIKHTGGATVSLGVLAVESRTETQVIEIVDGKASLTYPCVAITGEAWKSTSLGPLLYDPRTKEVSATDTTTNYGYGLVEVTYIVECYACGVQFPIGNSAQFILMDKE